MRVILTYKNFINGVFQVIERTERETDMNIEDFPSIGSHIFSRCNWYIVFDITFDIDTNEVHMILIKEPDI